jgi:tRNA(Arg) A34 adenosine deaminase TadA
VLNIADHPALNHRMAVVTGVCAAEAGQLLKDFFSVRR